MRSSGDSGGLGEYNDVACGHCNRRATAHPGQGAIPRPYSVLTRAGRP